MTVFLCLFFFFPPLGWLTVYVLFTRTQCLLLPLVANLWNINEISLKRHSADSDVQVFFCTQPRQLLTPTPTTIFKPVLTEMKSDKAPSSLPSRRRITPALQFWVFTRVHASEMSHFGKRFVGTQTGNNNELECKVCVRAQDETGPAAGANTHLWTSDAKTAIESFNNPNRWK